MTSSSSAAAPASHVPALAAWLERNFAHRLRGDVHARYIPPRAAGGKGAYVPAKVMRSEAHAELTAAVLEGHVSGGTAVGQYFFDPGTDGRVRAAVVDLDDKKKELTWLELCHEGLKVEQALAGRGLLAWPARSGSGHGIHLWLLWADLQDARAVRGELAAAVLSAALDTRVHVDLFPAQDRLPPPHADGTPALGNLVALPLGRLSRPILSLAEGLVQEDLGSWVPVDPPLSRGLVGTGGGKGQRGEGEGRAPAGPTPTLTGDDTLAADAGRGLQLMGAGDGREFGPVDPAELAQALGYVGADDYETWIRVTLAVKGAISGGQLAAVDGYRLWDEWSATSPKYDQAANDKAWDRGFRDRPGGVTLGTIWHLAREAGWLPPVRVLDSGTGGIRPLDRAGLLELRAESTPNQLLAGAKKFKEKDPHYYEKLLQWQKGSGTHEIDTLNHDHFQAFDGGRLYICKERWDSSLGRWTLEHRSVRDFRDANLDVVSVFTGMKPPVKHKSTGKELSPGGPTFKDRHVGDLWLESPFRRRYEEIVFKPAGCKDWQYNLWRGWAVEPSAAGSWSLFRQHMLENICRDDKVAYDYIFKWLAYTVQHMDEPIGTALVLKGNKGTGKGFFVKKIGQLFGQSFLQVSSTKGVTGSFNAHLRDCVLLFADEAFCSGSQADEARLNALITEETIPIEGKGRDVITCKNMLHVIMATNKDWAVPATADERRFCCVNVGDGGQLVRGYFDKVDDQLKNGGLARLLWDLLHEDLSGWDRRAVPATDEFLEQKLNNMDLVGKWWRYRLVSRTLLDGHDKWDKWVPAYLLFDDYVAFCDKARAGFEVARVGSQEHLSKELAKMLEGLPALGRKQRRVPGVLGQQGLNIARSDGSLPSMVKMTWEFPSLIDCRQAFSRWIRGDMNWEREEGVLVADSGDGETNNDSQNQLSDEEQVLF